MNAGFPTRMLGSLLEDGSIVEIQDGNHGEKHPTSQDYVAAGIPFLMASDIGSDGTPDLVTCKFIPKSLSDSLRIGFARENDVLLTHKGTIGRVAIVPAVSDYVMLTPQVTYYRVSPERLSNRFLGFAFRHPDFQRRMVSLSAQSTRPYIGITAQRQLEVFLPPLSTQRKIAGLLSAYDDLIENNSRRIAILEEMAQAIYREWFVHFRFPGHENAKFVDSPLGRIPEGWKIGRLDDVLVLQRGFDLPLSKRQTGGVPIYAATGVVGTHSEAKAKGPGVLTGRSGSLGTVLYVDEDYWPLNTALWVKEFKVSSPLFAYFTLQSLDFAAFNSGAAVPTLNRNDIHGLPTIVPPAYLARMFQELEEPLFIATRNHKLRIGVLRESRDLLLPKLISGQLNVEQLDIDMGEPLAEGVA